MPTFDVNESIQLHYEMKGEGEPLLLIGGLSTNKRIWSSMTDVLEARYQLVLPDNRGAGLSTQDCDPFTIDDMADDMVALIDHLGLDRVHVVGHSMGGMIVQSLCLRHSDRVNKAVIAGSAAKVQKHTLWHIMSTIRMMDEGVSFETVLNAMFPWMYADAFLADEECVNAELARMTEDATPQSYLGYVGQAKAIEQFNLLGQLGELNVPALVIAGSDDVLITKEATKSQLADVIPSAEYRELADCGHTFHREKPVEFTQMIVDFLQ